MTVSFSYKKSSDQKNWQSTSAVHYFYIIKSYIYICSITNIEHSLFMNIANNIISYIYI